ncbi:MAG TPA: gamma-glutamyl-gamma-aminobutyrate hydrolase family protein, partial [Candidatus Saccharimonadales bacterium]|nr:gamma-glutamyl-gamma-aminobutyrate hydrolase family protein [Candidatus Saccharimonadales bacterium]
MAREEDRGPTAPKPVVLINAWKRVLPTFLGPRTALYTLGEEYATAVSRAGGTPILVPHVDPSDIDTLIERADALLLSGGDDLHPASYGGVDNGQSHGTDRDADRTEIALVQSAARAHLPVLAICRGMQVLNVAFGGSLHQEITRPNGVHQPLPDDPEEILRYRHAVVTIEGTRLASLLGPGERLVNSIHHQAVDTIAAGFRVSAMAPDGVIEGMEYEGDWDAVGIQWHPEKTDDPAAMALFGALVDQARGRL